MNIVEELKQLGFNVFSASNLPPYYHEYFGNGLPEGNGISSIKDDSRYFIIDKPVGCLWLTTGELVENGKVLTKWREVVNSDEIESISNQRSCLVGESVFNPDPVVLDISEKDVSNLRKWVRSLGKHVPDKGRIPWFSLYNLGVDLVHVYGLLNRDHFYSWDIDTVVVLNGSSIVNWVKYPAKILV